jgi:iron complex transport system ATP-binding protein
MLVVQAGPGPTLQAHRGTDHVAGGRCGKVGAMPHVVPPVVRLSGVDVSIEGRPILAGIDLEVEPGDRWILLGPNGAGKTTLLRVMGGYLHPSRGKVEILGGELGRTDAAALQARIGQLSPALRGLVRDGARVDRYVAAGARGILDPAYDRPIPADLAAARELLARFGRAGLADRRLGSLSTGEGQQVQLCRALMADPELLILDEPFAGLDIGGREDLLGALGTLAGSPQPAAVVLVVHHLEEIPAGFGCAALLAGGRLVAAGSAQAVIISELLSAAFGLPLRVERRAGRYQGMAASGT